MYPFGKLDKNVKRKHNEPWKKMFSWWHWHYLWKSMPLYLLFSSNDSKTIKLFFFSDKTNNSKETISTFWHNHDVCSRSGWVFFLKECWCTFLKLFDNFKDNIRMLNLTVDTSPLCSMQNTNTLTVLSHRQRMCTVWSQCAFLETKKNVKYKYIQISNNSSDN